MIFHQLKIKHSTKRYINYCFRVCLVILLTQVLLYILRYKNDVPSTLNQEFQILNLNSTKTPIFPPLMDFTNPSEGSWQNVSGITAFKFLVYSAFLDIRDKKLIRVIAVTKLQNKRTRLLPPPWCKFWFLKRHPEVRSKNIPGEYQILKEHWSLPYSAYYILCPISPNDAVPDAISVLTSPEQTPENLLKVIANYDDDDKGKKWDPTDLSPLISKIAVCVKPIHYHFNRVIETLEFIEMHKLMGVNHFFLYNHTVGPQVGCILDKYRDEGTVTVLPWQLPIESQKEIRTEGLFASLNDCLFRTMHHYSHAIFVDFDEYIIPTTNYSYRKMFEYFHYEYDVSHKGAFSFRNAFFYRQWPDDPKVKGFKDPLEQNMILLRKTMRNTKFHQHRMRSKMIVRPELVNMVGNHFVWEFYDRRMFGVMEVDPNDAFLHHYRACEFGGDGCLTHPVIIDRTTYKYKNSLVKAVKTRYEQYLTECKLEQISKLNKTG